MPRPRSYHIRLTDEEAELLARTAADSSESETVRKRCRVLLLSDESRGAKLTRAEVAEKAGVHNVTVLNIIRLCDAAGVEAVLTTRRKAAKPAAPARSGGNGPKAEPEAAAAAPEEASPVTGTEAAAEG